MLPEKCQSKIQLANEYFSPTGLIILVPLKGGLNIAIGLKQKNQVDHDREPRIRCFTASQVVNSPGCCLKCSIRRSSSAITSLDTGISAGCDSRSFHSSETNCSFSEGESR